VPFGEWLDALRAGIGLVPPALIAMVLLGGPTAVWLLYRFLVQPHAARMRAIDRAQGPMFWVCPDCRSVNEIGRRWCYRCDAEPYEDELELIEADPPAARPLIPVGPGLDLGGPRPRPRPVASLESQAAGWETDTWAWETEDEEWEDEWEDEWEAESEEDRATLPDMAAMTEVVQAPGRRRSA
jgi:hypothetical protein